MSNSKANLMQGNDLVAMVIEGVHCIQISMIIELNMTTQGKSFEWWLHFGVTIHVCDHVIIIINLKNMGK